MLTQDMRTGRYTRFIVTLLMLLMYGAGEMWAQGVSVNIDNSITNGAISQSSISGREVTLTVSPTTSKYYTRASDIVVSPLAGSGQANAPRRVPGVANQIVGKMYKHGAERKAENEIYTIENPNSADYVFEVPAGYNDVYVTATFYLKSNEEITSSTSSVTYNAGGTYTLLDDIDASVLDNLYYSDVTNKTVRATAFAGTLTGVAKADGTFPVIRNLKHPLFATATGATIYNITLEDVDISQDDEVGAICSTANGNTRIYNCGILSGSVGGTGDTGGLVGLLEGTARVINCYSYADITGGNNVGGIVGNNNATTTAASINTMVMNCMFYGDITSGSIISPVYGGTIIDNLNSGGLNNFNYYAYDKLKTMSISEDKYYCALAVEEKYLNRIEFYRQLLNSNRKLAAYYASKSGATVNASDMAKWVLETADRTISNPKPYPILKAQDKYPSIINYDAEHAPTLFLENGKPSETDRNKGGKLGTLSVTISGVGSNAPTGATIVRSSLSLVRTDKDEDRFNFNYDKVQLPYYNDVGTKNYTGYRVVTGWKIISITSVANDPYTKGNYDYTKKYASNPEYFDYPNYNFADRKSSNKDLYSVSGRVFSQGAYFDVPYGVTSITIEPYWGNAAYVADEYLDVVCTTTTSGRNNYVSQSVTQLGKCFSSGKITINESEQKVYTSISSALGDSRLTGSTVYDNVVVLVGNLHRIGTPSDGNKPFTLMSVDLDKDNEPDCSLLFCNNDRNTISPIRFDFLNIIGMAHAQKPNGKDVILNAAIFRTKGWFEITNTSLIYFTQYEYENTGTKDKPTQITKNEAPLILLGGYIDQFVSAQSAPILGKTIYIHVGSNVLINSFGLGTHSDGSKATPHVPVSVTGGDYNGFYLTGTYNANAEVSDDNAECYVSGGRFGELAGAALEQIGGDPNHPDVVTNNGNVHWQIYDADITNFFGGGINDAKPVKGNITTEIFNSYVGTFCGGPKFGNMFVKSDGTVKKEVRTTAEGCVFDKFFGAGFGGNSFTRKKYYDGTDYAIKWTTIDGYYTNDKGKYYNGTTTGLGSGNPPQYGYKGPGVATDFDYEFFVWTSGSTGIRYFVKFVSFSLAQCNNVESTLKKCRIKENYYGGGSLGKVSGTAKSTLEDCTVTGNVFGAGYSATMPEIKVRTGSFIKHPSFNTSSGMFEPGVPAMPTSDDLTGMGDSDFEWMHKDDYPNNGNAGFLKDDGTYDRTNGKNVVTTVDISKTNLGSVGSVVLTLQGNTTVGGSVYGGGEQSTVNGTGNLGNTIVTLKGNTHVTGSVYGGGDNGKVIGSTTVNIEQ